MTKKQLHERASPYYQALDWITFDDYNAYGMCPHDPCKHHKNRGCSFTLIAEKDDEDVYEELVEFDAELWLSDTNACQ